MKACRLLGHHWVTEREGWIGDSFEVRMVCQVCARRAAYRLDRAEAEARARERERARR
jgi:hypothetical protein